MSDEVRDEDVEFFESLQRIFATRNDLKTVVEYQQRLYASLQQLNDNHKSVHDHVRQLTESHNRSQDDTATLVHARNDINDSVRQLNDSHRQTREEIRRAIESIGHIQNEIHKIPQLEAQLKDQEQRIRKLEGK